MPIVIVLIASMLWLSLPARAQTPPPPPPPPPVHEGSAEFAFVGTSGNSDTDSIGLGGEIIYRPDSWETRLKVSYVRNKAEDVVKAQTVTLTGRAQRAINSRLAGYGQYGYLRDQFAGILARNTVEAGLAYSAVDRAPHKLNLDAGFGYANEHRLTSSDLSTGIAGAGGVYLLKISSTSDLSEDGHFVFSLSEGRDWRYTNAVALTAKVTTIFSLKASNVIRYVRTPVVGFKGTDTVTSVALVAKF